MAWLADMTVLLWFAALQFCVYGLGWAVCAYFVKIERRATVLLSAGLLVMASILLLLPRQMAANSTIAALYCLVGMVLNIGFLIYLLKRFEQVLIDDQHATTSTLETEHHEP